MTFQVGDRVRLKLTGAVGTILSRPTIGGRVDYEQDFRPSAVWETDDTELEPHVDVFPIAADKDPWRESEPRAERGASYCGSLGSSVGYNSGGVWACTRAQHSTGHHVSRDLDGNVNARWPQAAPAEKRGNWKREPPPVGAVVTYGNGLNEIFATVFRVDGDAILARFSSGVEWEIERAAWELGSVNLRTEKRGPRVGDEVVLAEPKPNSVGRVGERGAVDRHDGDHFHVMFERWGSTLHMSEFGTVVVPPAEWDARQKRDTERAPALKVFDGESGQRLISEPPPEGRFDFIKNGDVTGTYPTPKCQPTTPESIKAAADALTRHLESVTVHPSAVARSLFELDFAEHAIRVGDDGRGGIGKAAVLERMWSRASAETLAEYGWRAAIVLKRAGEIQ